MILAPFQSHRPSTSSPLRPASPASPPLPVYNVPDTPGRQRSAFVSVSSAIPLPVQLKLRLQLLPHLPRRKLLSFIALFLLLVISCLTISRGLSTYSYPYQLTQQQSQPLHKPKHVPNPNTRLFLQRKQIELSPPEELAAVIQFLTSQVSNSLPLSVNPLEPIDPQLVCGFDTRGSRAADEVKWMTEEVWVQHPVLLFIESRSPATRALLSIITDLNISPQPSIFIFEERSDTEILVPLLQRLTKSTSLPLLLVGGQIVGPGIEDIKALYEDGSLKTLINNSGAVVGGSRRRKGRRR